MSSIRDYRSKVVRKWNGVEIETVVPKSGGGIYLFIGGVLEGFVECDEHDKVQKIAEGKILSRDN